MKNILFVCFFAISFSTSAQQYANEVFEYRENYKKEFLESERSPLKAADIRYLQFYDPDESYLVNATFKITPDEKPFDIATYSGKTKPYIKYGILEFKLKNTIYQLSVYRSMNLMNDSIYRNHLFIPFKDHTNGGTTYGGGRYLDYNTTDIKNNILLLDFNKAYNPYCAYSSGYSCPIPPLENTLDTSIEAGEKSFGKEH